MILEQSLSPKLEVNLIIFYNWFWEDMTIYLLAGTSSFDACLPCITLYIVYEQGEALFQTHENLEHLAMMERVLGPIPQHMVHRAE